MHKNAALLFFLVLFVAAVFLIFTVIKFKPFNMIGKSSDHPIPKAKILYKSHKYAYSLSYPEEWLFDGSRSQAPADLFSEKNKNAFVSVQTGEDVNLVKDKAVSLIGQEIKKEFTVNKDYKLDEFKETTLNFLPGFLGRGSFKDKNSLWDFTEYTLFPGGNTFYVIRGNVKQSATAQEKSVMEGVASSFEIFPFRRLLSLAEVREFKKLVEENKRSTFHIEIEKTGNSQEPMVIRIFEVFPDHQVTFNRYRVDPKGESVWRYDAVTDSWQTVASQIIY